MERSIITFCLLRVLDLRFLMEWPLILDIMYWLLMEQEVPLSQKGNIFVLWRRALQFIYRLTKQCTNLDRMVGTAYNFCAVNLHETFNFFRSYF